MAEIDAEQEARLKRFQLMKRLLVIVPLSTILILFCLCMFLGIRLHSFHDTDSVLSMYVSWDQITFCEERAA